MCAVLSTSRIPPLLLQGLAAPLAGLWFVAKRPRLWAAVARFALLSLPVTLITPLVLLVFNYYGWRIGSAAVDGHKAAWFLRSLVACVLIVGSVSLTHLAWTASLAGCTRWAALSLARQTEHCLGIPKEEFCTSGEQGLLAELQTDLRIATIAWGFLSVGAAAPVVGQILCVAATPFLASSLIAHWLFYLPRSLRKKAPGRDFPFIDRHILIAAPLGFSSLVACLIPILGAMWAAGCVVAAVRLFRWLDESGGMMTPKFATMSLAAAELERFDG